jgi:hypothetical protein
MIKNILATLFFVIVKILMIPALIISLIGGVLTAPRKKRRR